MGKIIQLLLFLRKECFPIRERFNTELPNIDDKIHLLLDSKNFKKKIYVNFFHYYWRKFDDNYFKPFLIDNYNKRVINENESVKNLLRNEEYFRYKQSSDLSILEKKNYEKSLESITEENQKFNSTIIKNRQDQEQMSINNCEN